MRWGKHYNNLIYTEDVALLAATEDNIQQVKLVNAVGKAYERFGL